MDYREVSEIRDGMRIDWDMPIEMDDGIVLRCDIYRPIERRPISGDHDLRSLRQVAALRGSLQGAVGAHVRDHPDVPTGSTNKYQCWEVVDPEKWVPDGYVCIRVDSRGAGRSPGVIDIWSLREAQDLAQCVEWAGVQPWSNGKVGLNGISYYAENQWQARRCSPSTSPRSVSGRAPPISTATWRTTAASSARLRQGLVEGAGLYAAERPRHARLQEPHERRLGVGPARR